MTARAAVWDGAGFQVARFPLPEPGPGEALVRVRMATICGSDLHTLRGARPAPVPIVLGHEAVGHVVAAGPGIRTCSGAPVVEGMRLTWTIGTSCGECRPCVRGLSQKCAHRRKYGHERSVPEWRLSGGFADHCHLLAGTGSVEVPPEVPDAVITPANCATATVVNAVRRAAPGADDVVVVQGCGMLGLTALAYLRHLGVRAIAASDPHPARRRAALRFGAAVATAPERLDAEVRELSGGEGAAAVLELSGSGAAAAASLDLLGTGGHLVLVGSVLPVAELDVAPEAVVRRLLTISGVHNYGLDDLAEAVRFLATGVRHEDFAALVPSAFPLDSVAAAVSAADRGEAPRVAIAPGW